MDDSGQTTCQDRAKKKCGKVDFEQRRTSNVERLTTTNKNKFFFCKPKDISSIGQQ